MHTTVMVKAMVTPGGKGKKNKGLKKEAREGDTRYRLQMLQWCARGGRIALPARNR